MIDKLTDFLTNISTDTDLRDNYMQDKEGTMKAHGVSEEHRNLILNNKHAEVEQLLNAEYDVAVDGIITGFKKK